MGRQIRNLVNSPSFVTGMALRVILVALLYPVAQAEWFVPFVDNSISSPSINPWSSHLSSGGDVLAFPYGPIMWLIALPGTVLGALGGVVFPGADATLTAIGFSAGIVVIDLLLLLVLLQIEPERRRAVIWLYWLSPIVLYVNYWHGQLDIIPVLLLTTTLVLLRRHKYALAGVILGVTFAAKLSMVLALPFILIYLVRNNRFRRFSPVFVAAVLSSALLLQGPYLLSRSVREMVIDTPEAQKIYDLSLDLGSFEILLLPLGYGLVVYIFWQLRRMSFSLLLASLGLGFFLVLILSPASPGWFMWVVPFLVIYQIQSGRGAVLISLVFSVLLVVFNLLQTSGATVRYFDFDFTAPLVESIEFVSESQLSLLLTALLAAGGILAYRMARDGIRESDHFGLRTRPLVLGISGDSGSGKDTLASAIGDIFGSHSVAHISGDDYHLWDRDQPLWQTTTHLNPRANDLTAMLSSVVDLSESRNVSVERYDHSIGRFASATSLSHNAFVLVAGLLVFYLPQMRERCDLKIFLDMDEGLRRYFKVQRDVNARGYSLESVLASVESRAEDADRFIKPQAKTADVVFGIEPTKPLVPGDYDVASDVQLQLRVSLRKSLYHEKLARLLIGGCGLAVESDLNDADYSIELLITGSAFGSDIAEVARRLVPQSEELVDVEPIWHDGMIGVMQLVVMAQAAQVLRDRSS